MKKKPQTVTAATNDVIDAGIFTDTEAVTDEEADLILQRLLWLFRDAVNPVELGQAIGRSVVFEVTDKQKARDWVRMFVRVED